MAYPSSPWTLQGYALQTLQLIDVEQVRPFIAPELDIVSVLPGKTLGGVYLSCYGSGSVLEYSELIVAAGIVRYSGKIGGWISHIYVDNPDSVAGGRNIWGLPKELAEFTWEKGSRTASGYENCVTVRQGEQTLCQLSYNQQTLGLPLPFSGNVFSTHSESILLFNGKFEGSVGTVGSKLQVPVESPFASLGLDRPWLTFYGEKLRMVIGTPEVVGRTEAAFSYR
ncbi:MAG: acetoacetate decarboxylase family protein [Cyanobacteriota bacterium]|nr:acetoacetate decarboxylase family protein [Cyanobacteriota bacterium]